MTNLGSCLYHLTGLVMSGISARIISTRTSNLPLHNTSLKEVPKMAYYWYNSCPKDRKEKDFEKSLKGTEYSQST